MNIILLSIGKTQSPHYAALEEEYAHRIRGRFSLTRMYVKHTKELLHQLELLHKQGNPHIVLCDEHGSVMNSREFAQYMDTASQQGRTMVYIIGDAAGLPEEVRAYNADILALSEFTFPHELARVLLIEQLYRAQTILQGHPYHK